MNTIKLNTIGTPKVSGGNSGGGGSASSVEYLDITNAKSKTWIVSICMCSLFVKQEVPIGETRVNSVLPTFHSQAVRGDLMGVNQLAIDFKALISIDGIYQKITVAEYVMEQGATQADIDAIPRITEEEFYTL